MMFFSLFLFSFSLKPIYLIGGFNNSPIYGTITDHSLNPECPSDLNKTILTADFINNNPDCIAKLLRAQLNPTSGKVQQLPGVITDSSFIGPSSNLIDAFSNIIEKAKSKQYIDGKNLFSVGYNYYLHPITSYSVYDKLKAKIEEVYKQTEEKAVLISYDQGTSFLSIFISNYSSTKWVQKYIDSVIFIGPSFAGTSSFDYLFNQNLPNFPENDEIKKSIMRMPGLHILLPNYAVFDDQTVIYNMNQDFDQHGATFSFEFLKNKGKVDEESEKIFKANVEKFLKVPIPEPPVPSLIIYNDGIKMKSRYSVFQHQEGKVSKMYDEPSDGTITPNGANYACGHWKSTTCKNLYDTTNHESLLASDKVTEYVFDYIESSKPIQSKKKLGLFIASGFQGSPLYGTVTDSSKATMCPPNLKHTLFHSTLTNSRSLIDDSNNFWLSDDCVAMLARVELDPTEKFVTYAPGIHLESSKFGEFDYLLSYTKIIPRAFQEGYTQYKDFFGVGYNYMLHPLMTGEVYEKLKLEIEKYYNETGQRSVITGHSQGTSFVEIFITDYVSKEWAEKYVQGVIFYAPAFSGWGTYGRLVSSNYGSSFPDSKAVMKTSTQRMPGLHIMMPNEGVYGNKTVITNFPNQGDNSNASYALPLLKKLNRMDETAEKIFHLTDKYRVPPLPEPPVPSLIIYNNYTATGNGYNYNSDKNSVSVFNGVGDGTVSSDGPEYACKNWKNVQCYNYNLNGISHGNIQEQRITLDLTFDFINNIQAFQPLNSNNYRFFEGVNGKYTDQSYLSNHKINTSRLTYHATGDNAQYPLSNAFDEAETTFFVSNMTNTDEFHNSIYINFDKNLSLEAFLYDTAYSSGSNYLTYHGIAKQLKVFGSCGNKPFELKSVFIGTPTFPYKRFQFVFKEPIFVDKIKIEFVDITPNEHFTSGTKNPTVGNLILIENFDGIPLSTTPVGGNFADSTYVTNNRVPNTFLTYSGSEGLSGFPLSNVFDDDAFSLYIAKNENTNDYHNYIDITFKHQIKLEAILYDSGYSSRQQIFHGFPKRLKILSAKGNDELTAKATFIGSPTWPDKRYQFVFNEPITCDKIRLEFMEVTPETTKSGGKLCPLVGNLIFIKQIEIQKANIVPVEGQYANNEYVNERKIPNTAFTGFASSEKDKYPLSNAFDDKITSFWVSEKPNTYSYHNYIDISFKNTVVLEAILYDGGYKSATGTFFGFPKILKIYSATGDEKLKENTLFIGEPKWPSKQYQFVFNEPTVCDKIRIEFIDVTPENSFSDGQLCPLVGNLHFIQKVVKLSNVDITDAKDKFNDPNYLNLHLVPKSMFNPSSTESKTQYPFENLFDNNNSTFWVAQNPNDDNFHNKIWINFTSIIKVEALLFDYSFYSTNGWTFHGAPKQLLVHTSIGSQQYQQHTLFTGEPSGPHKRYQFVFEEPVKCDKILIEFVEVTPESHSSKGNLNPMLANIHIIQAFDYEIRSIVPISGFYLQEFYKSEHRIPNKDFTYYGTEGKSGRPLSNAFDDKIESFWVAKDENTDNFINYIDISFKHQTKLEAILYDSGYSSSQEVFHGFPKKLNIYTSISDSDFQLHTVFVGTPTWPNKQYQFVFDKPVTCDNIRLEFVEVTPETSASNGKLCPLVGNLLLYQYLDLPELTYSLSNGNYANNNYVNSHKIDSSRFTPEASGSASGKPLSNCFDGSTTSMWIAKDANTDTYHNYIEVTFKSTVAIEAFLYNAGYSTSSQTHHGFPLRLIIHTSIGTNQMMPITQFVGQPTWDGSNKRFQFVFTNKVICDKIRIEFVEVTPEGSASNNALKPLCVELIFIESSTGIPLQTPIATMSSTPMPSHTPLPLEVNCINNNRCEAQGTEKQKVNVDVSFSGFIDLDNSVNGGAILLEDVSFNIKNTEITRCTAIKGGGGGIYINNKNGDKIEDGFTGLIQNIKFDGCKADYGGAIFIYSNQQKDPIYIQKCIFIGNSVTLTESPDNSNYYYGGSAIFIQVQKGILKFNKFRNNNGGGSVKILNLELQDESNKLNLLNSNNKNSFVLISSSEFQSNNLSTSSVFYVAGENGVNLELKNCVFNGDLKKGVFHVDGISLSKKAPKMKITKCIFDSDEKASINLNLNALLVDLKNQKFNNEKVNVNAASLVLPLPTLAIVVMIAFVLIKKKIKMERNENYDDNNDSMIDQNEI